MILELRRNNNMIYLYVITLWTITVVYWELIIINDKKMWEDTTCLLKRMLGHKGLVIRVSVKFLFEEI